MKERPILFSGPMVRAILEGRKTQTRRVLKYEHFHGCLTGDCPHQKQDECDACLAEYANTECPYGVPGDRLWVRESWALTGDRLIDPCLVYRADNAQLPICKHKGGHDLWYPDGCSDPITSSELIKPDLSHLGWRVSIHMPRWASRITLDITDVRVQLVQEISAFDAIDEGVQRQEAPYDAREPFRDLWDSINAKRGFGWETNPWVWALTFKKIETAKGQVA